MPAAMQSPRSVATRLRVGDGADAAFSRWQARLTHAASLQRGFLSIEFIPLHAGSCEWRAVQCFRVPGQLDAWLASSQRCALLRQAEGLASWKSHRMPSSFAGWFPPGRVEPSAPAAWKQAAIVLLVLFPAVMLELRFLSPLLAGLNPALATFIGNAISVALVTWPLAPLAIRSLRWWLQPDPARRARAELAGFATLAAS